MDENLSKLNGWKPAARIVVIGIGGAGNNAVNRMIDDEISDVEFYVMNTDLQTLATSKTPNRLVLGKKSTEGLGAGGDPEVGKKAAEESADDIKRILSEPTKANLVFIASGMGGGTGTGAAPVVAKIAKDLGALTIAIVTRPFQFEGQKRLANSVDGLNKLKTCVDSFIVVSNDNLLYNSDSNKPIAEAFREADRVLSQSVQTVVDLVLTPAIINLDFADVRSTLQDAGIALIGYGLGKGPNKAADAAANAVGCNLLETTIQGARRAICSITCGPQVSLYEVQECVNKIIEAAGNELDVKFGVAINDNLSDDIVVSVIASDFDKQSDYTALPTFDLSSAMKNKINNKNAAKTVEKEQPKKVEPEEDDDDGLLPDFLKKLK